MTGDSAAQAPALGLVSLDDPGADAPALVGNKAATLAVLRRAGFQVPPGVVVPAEALAGAADELPAGVRAALLNVPEVLGPGPWAVRSSSTAEDAERASFAGQFETVLGVDADGLADAVGRVARSGRSERVKVYSADGGAGSMAILIQPMIAAQAAGVAFTTDPVSGQHRTVIEAVEGLGERLVFGSASPERWTVEDDDSIGAPPSSGAALDAGKAKAIGGLARRVEEHFQRPQDIEWAIENGSVWLLQARPITTLPNADELLPIPIEVPPGPWERDPFHQPAPFTPFVRTSYFGAALRDAMATTSAEFGILIDRIEHSVIGGWLYARVLPVGAPPPRPGRGSLLPNPPPRWLLAILMRLHPAIRRRTRAAREAIASDLPFTVIRRWFNEWRPEHQEDTKRALAVDLRSISDEELVAQLDHRIEVVGHPAHAAVAWSYFVIMRELGDVCEDLLHWDTAKMLSLLEGLSTTSTDPARQLAHLTELAHASPAIRELLGRIDERTPDRLAQVDPEFAQAFSTYVEANGHRVVGYDVIEPTLAEIPHLLLGLVADQLEREFSPDQEAQEALRRRSDAADDARRLLTSHPEADRKRFERALARASETYPAWEDRVWWTQSVQLALLRYLGIEIGRRLVERGQLAAVEDVFFLETPDLRSALVDGVDRSDAARVANRQRAWAMANPGPPTYGVPPAGEPPFDLLPPDARQVNRAVLWGIGEFYGSRGAKPFAMTPNAASLAERDATLVGTPASAGRYTGTVRVVMGEHEFDKIQSGDVVVCPVTSPVWSVVFPSIGALVTDAGGILSHPAIIAREHGIPAVVGTGRATGILKDGQTVTVDGTRGVVEAMSTPSAAEAISDQQPIINVPSAAPEPIPIEVPPGYWAGGDFHGPSPISPFGWVMGVEQVLKVFPIACAEFGVLIDRVEATIIGGWPYMQMIPVGAPPPGRGPASQPPRWLVRLLLRLHPAIRRRNGVARRAVASDLPMTVIRRWFGEWRPEHRREIDRALALDLPSLSDEQLAAELDRRIEMVGHPAHVMVSFAYWLVVYELAEVCRELLGWDTARTLTLLEGLSTTSTEPARQLADLTRLARSKPAVRELLTEVETTPGRLGDVDPEFAEAFSNYVETNGHRILTYDVIEPTLAEEPHVLLRLVADQLEGQYAPARVAEGALRRRSQAAEEARRMLAPHPQASREHFERALARAREAYPALEDRAWWTYFVQGALLRYLALEIGRRLADRGQVKAVEDVFFLEAPDARSALFDGTGRGEKARRAKSQRAWAMAHPGPDSYGGPPPGDPPFDLLPRAARFVNEGVVWGLSHTSGEERPAPRDQNVLAGTPASPGQYTGRVRVVMGEHEFDKIRAGDVVVCPATSPSWSVVFSSMGALVTDMGGILSHPAIIAREHGIPAVVGTGNATVRLRDAQRVTVDGSLGSVTLIADRRRQGRSTTDD